MNPSGLWRGKSQGRVGHFKFINVELLPDRNTLRQQRRSAVAAAVAAASSAGSSSSDASADAKSAERSTEKLKDPGPPQSVEDLLKRIGLEVNRGDRGTRGHWDTGHGNEAINPNL